MQDEKAIAIAVLDYGENDTDRIHYVIPGDRMAEAMDAIKSGHAAWQAADDHDPCTVEDFIDAAMKSAGIAYSKPYCEQTAVNCDLG